MKPFGVILQVGRDAELKGARKMDTTDKQPPTSTVFCRGRRQIMTAGAMAMIAIGSRPSPAIADPNAEIVSSEEAIHQKRDFRATRQRVYAALTVGSQFDKIIQLTGVMKAEVMAKMQKPTKLSARAGSEFALFGGYIVGRQIELVPSELIVQAWRVLGWPRGIYSIARFALSDQGGATQLVFDHIGFPKGEAEHLASGWQENYWDPLAKFLA
jgi:activator of HSP90 ATPase